MYYFLCCLQTVTLYDMVAKQDPQVVLPFHYILAVSTLSFTPSSPPPSLSHSLTPVCVLSPYHLAPHLLLVMLSLYCSTVLNPYHLAIYMLYFILMIDIVRQRQVEDIYGESFR